MFRVMNSKLPSTGSLVVATLGHEEGDFRAALAAVQAAVQA